MYREQLKSQCKAQVWPKFGLFRIFRQNVETTCIRSSFSTEIQICIRNSSAILENWRTKLIWIRCFHRSSNMPSKISYDEYSSRKRPSKLLKKWISKYKNKETKLILLSFSSRIRIWYTNFCTTNIRRDIAVESYQCILQRSNFKFEINMSCHHFSDSLFQAESESAIQKVLRRIFVEIWPRYVFRSENWNLTKNVETKWIRRSFSNDFQICNRNCLVAYLGCCCRDSASHGCKQITCIKILLHAFWTRFFWTLNSDPPWKIAHKKKLFPHFSCSVRCKGIFFSDF